MKLVSASLLALLFPLLLVVSGGIVTVTANAEAASVGDKDQSADRFEAAASTYMYEGNNLRRAVSTAAAIPEDNVFHHSTAATATTTSTADRNLASASFKTEVVKASGSGSYNDPNLWQITDPDAKPVLVLAPVDEGGVQMTATKGRVKFLDPDRQDSVWGERMENPENLIGDQNFLEICLDCGTFQLEDGFVPLEPMPVLRSPTKQVEVEGSLLTTTVLADTVQPRTNGGKVTVSGDGIDVPGPDAAVDVGGNITATDYVKTNFLSSLDSDVLTISKESGAGGSNDFTIDFSNSAYPVISTTSPTNTMYFNPILQADSGIVTGIITDSSPQKQVMFKSKVFFNGGDVTLGSGTFSAGRINNPLLETSTITSATASNSISIGTTADHTIEIPGTLNVATANIETISVQNTEVFAEYLNNTANLFLVNPVIEGELTYYDSGTGRRLSTSDLHDKVGRIEELEAELEETKAQVNDLKRMVEELSALVIGSATAE